MERDIRLVNIYLKIHHKRTLTLDDLEYLAEYDPECFLKTCKNVVYNIPETKPIMESPVLQAPDDEAEVEEEEEADSDSDGEAAEKTELSKRQYIEKILQNLRHLEINNFPVNKIDAERVKNLLGNLYIEMLFPHNDTDMFFSMEKIGKSSFDKKA